MVKWDRHEVGELKLDDFRALRRTDQGTVSSPHSNLYLNNHIFEHIAIFQWHCIERKASQLLWTCTSSLLDLLASPTLVLPAAQAQGQTDPLGLETMRRFPFFSRGEL